MSDLLRNFTNPFATLSETSWYVLATVGALLLLAVLGLVLRRLKMDTRTLVLASLCIALSFILSTFKFYQMPQGGSITPASMLPVMLFAWAFGPVPGIAAGVVYGGLQLLQDFYVVHPVQLLLDYVFAFGALGLAGFFRKNLLLGIAVAGLARFVFHVLSGVVFFAEYAAEAGYNSALLYSMAYNMSVILPDAAICLVIAAIPGFRRAMERVFKASAAVKA